MIITLKIDEFSFADLAVKLLPILKNNAISPETAIGKLLEAVTQLPEDVVRSVFNAIPEHTQNEIVSLLAAEHQEKLLEAADTALEKYDIDLTVDFLTLSPELELEVAVSHINYTALAVRFFPMLGKMEAIQDTPAAALLQHLRNLPGILLRTAVDALPQDKKDDLVIYLVNRFKDKILEKITALAEAQGIWVAPDALVIRK